MKANSSLAILRLLAQAGCGFDIVSGGELERVLAAGGDPAQGDLFRRGQDPRRNAQALDVGIGCFNVESEPNSMC
jgi:diaminopimelate decarboxylase